MSKLLLTSILSVDTAVLMIASGLVAIILSLMLTMTYSSNYDMAWLIHSLNYVVFLGLGFFVCGLALILLFAIFPHLVKVTDEGTDELPNDDDC